MGLRTLLACMYRKFSRNSRLLVVAEIADRTEFGRGRVRHMIRRLIKRQADDFLVLGEAGARYIRTLGVPSTKISKIGYTTDLSKFCDLALMRSEPNAYRMLYVGQLVDRKGLLPFLKTLARWSADHPGRKVDMLIVGDGPCNQDLKKIDWPVNLTVTFHGNMAFSDLPAIYLKCGLFAFPTLADTWGVVVNEAMAAGLPVLGSIYSQAVEEMLEDGRNGWLFRPDDAEAVYAAIGKALNASIDSLNRMRHFARQTAMLYSPDAMAAKISEAVERVLSNN
jgi:glycosyltransferase involved in cell wall biosynthesis